MRIEALNLLALTDAQLLVHETDTFHDGLVFPTAGFFAKYYLFSAAIEQGMVGLAVIAVLNSALSLYFYLRVIVAMYMRKSDTPLVVHDDFGTRVVLLISLLAILWLGIGPTGLIPGVENILEWAQASLASVAGM